MMFEIRKHILVWIARMLVLVTLWVPTMVSAVEVANLYGIEIPVENQRVETRQAGFVQALEWVLVRISGNRAIAATPGGKGILADAARYVRQYRYRIVSEDERTVYLWVEFDGAAVELRMRGYGLSVWGSNRPGTLMWVGVEEAFKRRMLADDANQDLVRQQFNQVAVRRGLPLLFPVMDAEDQAKVGYAEARGDFPEQILDASTRYNADVIVTVVLLKRPNSAIWESQWMIYRDGTSNRWEAQGALQDVVASGMDNVGDVLVSRYSTNDSQQSQRHDVLLEVGNLQNFSSYAATLKHLRSISEVRLVQPVWVHDDVVRFKLLVQGDTSNLERSLMLGRMLLPREQGAAELPIAATEAVSFFLRYGE